jgi:hypothetical protein
MLQFFPNNIFDITIFFRIYEILKQVHMKKSIALFCFMMVRIIALPAQDIDSMMGLYAGDFQQEKIYIHFDKSIYNKGETLWFKAYVMAGSEPSGYSKNFYVDWFNDEGKLLSHTASPMFESSARGQFIIPEKYTGKLIHAKAYTNWMLNFDTAFLYRKGLRIYQPVAKNENIQNGKPFATIQFFPEGGDLVGGVMQRVAFLATNQYATPVSVSGVLKNSRNELIDSFSTTHDGMGSFTFDVDAKETYSANWVDEYGENHSTNLLVTRQAAATMLVRQSNSKITFVISRSEEAADNFKTLYTVAHMNQQLLYKSRINFSSSTSVIGEIQIQDLPTGILQITIFDASWVPIAERVVFVNNHQYRFDPAISIKEKGLNKRERSSIDLVVEDSVISNMSMAVTDAGLLNDGSNTIISQLLLAGDIKGYVHNPSYYFSSDADSVHQHLDLVMLTHGWRRFDWAAIFENRLPHITNAKDTDYLQIKGSIQALNKAKPAKANQVINLIVEAKDSSKQFLFLPVSTQGTFLQKEIIYYDTIKIYYQFNGDKRLTDKASVSFENGLAAPPTKLFNTEAVSPVLDNWSSGDSLVSERSKLFYEEKLRLDKMPGATPIRKSIKINSPYYL